MITREAIMSVLETRFDYYSARVLFKEAASKIGLGEKDALDPDKVRALAEAFVMLSPKSEGVVNALNNLAGGKGDGKAEPKAEPKAEKVEAKAEEPEAEAPAEAEAEAAEESDKPKKKKK